MKRVEFNIRGNYFIDFLNDDFSDIMCKFPYTYNYVYRNICLRPKLVVDYHTNKEIS